MPAKKYRIKLTPDERASLRHIADAPDTGKERRRRANILLMADEAQDGGGSTDREIASAYRCRVRTVESVREACFERGPEAAVERKKRSSPPRGKILDGRAEAELVRLACSTPPEGHAKWSLRLLAGKLVELEVVEAISHQSVGNALKKTRSSPGS